MPSAGRVCCACLRVSSCSLLGLTDTLEPVCVYVCVPASSLTTCTYIPVYVTTHVGMYFTPERHPSILCMPVLVQVVVCLFFCALCGFTAVHMCLNVQMC